MTNSYEGELHPSVLQKINAEISKYPEPRAAVKSALRYAQAEAGWINTDIINAIAKLLGIEPIEVYEVATFYDMFYTEPMGRHPIRVCTNISCLLRGSKEIVNDLCYQLSINVGETTSDGRFTLLEAECLGACGGSPMMIIDDDYHENLSPNNLKSILELYL